MFGEGSWEQFAIGYGINPGDWTVSTPWVRLGLIRSTAWGLRDATLPAAWLDEIGNRLAWWHGPQQPDRSWNPL